MKRVNQLETQRPYLRMFLLYFIASLVLGIAAVLTEPTHCESLLLPQSEEQVILMTDLSTPLSSQSKLCMFLPNHECAFKKREAIPTPDTRPECEHERSGWNASNEF